MNEWIQKIIEGEKKKLQEEKYQIIYIALLPILIFTIIKLTSGGSSFFTTLLTIIVVLLIEFFGGKYIADKAYDFLKMDSWFKNTNVFIKKTVEIIVLNIILMASLALAIIMVASKGNSSNTSSNTNTKSTETMAKEWDWDAYCFGYSPSHNCYVGVRTKNKYWNGKYWSLQNELKMLCPDVMGNPSLGYGECRSSVDIWYEV